MPNQSYHVFLTWNVGGPYITPACAWSRKVGKGNSNKEKENSPFFIFFGVIYLLRMEYEVVFLFVCLFVWHWTWIVKCMIIHWSWLTKKQMTITSFEIRTCIIYRLHWCSSNQVIIVSHIFNMQACIWKWPLPFFKSFFFFFFYIALRTIHSSNLSSYPICPQIDPWLSLWKLATHQQPLHM